MRRLRWSVVLLLGATAAFGGRLSFEEHAAVQESLARVHPRVRASWLRERGLDDSYYTTFRRPENTGLECVGRWPWGPSWELAGRDTFLYLGSGSGVRILSIADSVQPRMLGQINARGLVSGLAVQDTLLFVAGGSWGAQVYSVSDPSNPRELGSMDAVIGTICAQDTVCFTLGGDSLTVYDVANPGQPMRLAAVQDAGGILAFNNGYVFSAGSGGLNVYDVRVPTAPTWVGSRGGSYLGLFARGTLLFCTGIQPSYFTILDVSDPASMVQLGSINGYGGEDICVLGHLACLSCVYDHHGLYTIDVSDSTHPQLLGNYAPDGAEFFDVYIRPDGLRSYIASWYGGLSVGDISAPSTPHEIWFGYQADQAADVAIDGSRAYVSDLAGGMRILDVSDPSVLTELGLYDVIGNKDVRTATARDSFAFVCRDGSAGRKYLHVVGVLDPSNPTLVAQESCYNPPEDYVLKDSLLYAAEANMFQVFNVARPREPVLVGSCVVPDYAWNMDLEGDLAGVAHTISLQLVDVAQPDSPRVVGSWPGDVSGVDIVDTIAYVTAPYTGYVSLSIANPAAPYVLDSVYAEKWWNDIVVDDSLAFAGGTWVQVLDVSDPRNMRLVGSWAPPYLVRRLEYRAPYLYAACYEAGVCILKTAQVSISEEHGRARPEVRSGALCPNPASKSVTVRAGPSLETITVYDALGRVARQFRPGGAVFTMDLTGLQPGAYFMELQYNTGKRVEKLIKR